LNHDEFRALSHELEDGLGADAELAYDDVEIYRRTVFCGFEARLL
jgi:hypothetical protein